jgi:hypothetical protein
MPNSQSNAAVELRMVSTHHTHRFLLLNQAFSCADGNY